jgi:hypothetical protein
MELQNNPPAEVVQKLHNFADVKATDSIIVTLTLSPAINELSALSCNR